MPITGKLARAWAPSAVTCLVLLGSATGALGAASAAAPISSVPRPGSSSELSGISCTLPRDCWAVGDFRSASGAQLNQALHWNGRKWSLVPTPSPGGTQHGASSQLSGVACPLPTSCWAVGDYHTSGNSITFLNQALHWNSKTWTLVPTPDPGLMAQRAFDSLVGVRCISASNCWAVGSFANPGNGVFELNQALHWNGRQWSKVPTPNPDGIAAGAGNELIDVTCTAPVSCWAVGDYGRITGSLGVRVNQALHWNGRRWSLVPTPDPGGLGNDDSSGLTAIRCPSPASCWAVGVVSTKGQANLNEILHWNGASWSAG